MYAIQEPIVGLISGIFGSLYFFGNKNKKYIKLVWRIVTYAFILFATINVFKNLEIINDDKFYGSKNYSNEFIFSIIIASLMISFVVLLEIINFVIYKKHKKNNRGYELFLFCSLIVIINIMLFSFILGPKIQLEYLKYIGSSIPTGYIKNGVIYLLIPRILKECVKTPIYIILLFSIVYALKKQYENMINIAKNKWSKENKQKTSSNFLKNIASTKEELAILNILYHFGELKYDEICKLTNIKNHAIIQKLVTFEKVIYNNTNDKYKINSYFLKY